MSANDSPRVTLAENVITNVDYQNKVVEVSVKQATLKDFKAMQGVFLSLLLALQTGKGDFKVVDSIDTIVSALAVIRVNKEALLVEDLPIDLLGRVVELVVEANFTQSKLSSWVSVADKLQMVAKDAKPAA